MPSPSRSLLLRAAILGALTVGLGAFGAHGLKDVIAKIENGRDYWQTATHYALPHAAAIAGLAGYARQGMKTRLLLIAGNCWFAGSIVFAGTLMAMALGAPRWFGAITPIGGLALIAGWLIAGIAAWRADVK